MVNPRVVPKKVSPPVAFMLTLGTACLAAPAASACPPSCPNNELIKLLDTYCSDKARAHMHAILEACVSVSPDPTPSGCRAAWVAQGTFWQSKHHFGTAYHALFGSIRGSISSIMEIGIGEDTAPSVQAWATYFPYAHVYPVDIKTRKEVAERAKPGGATERLVRHQAQFGCEYNRSMWDNPRVHLTLETDASNPEQLKRVSLPPQLDIILDDGSHKYLDQQRTLHTLWERLRPGGFYIIEDMLVGALPWSSEHAKQVPTRNSECGAECFFPQKLAEHPFLFDRFGHLKGASAPAVPLEPRTKALLRTNDWFWVVTGVHQGGGLDCALVIRKSGPAILPAVATLAPPAVAPTATTGSMALSMPIADASGNCAAGCVAAGTLRDAHSALSAAHALQQTLQARQAELAARLERACPHAVGRAPLGGGQWPLLALLAVSVGLNFVQWQRRSHPGRASGK